MGILWTRKHLLEPLHSNQVIIDTWQPYLTGGKKEQVERHCEAGSQDWSSCLHASLCVGTDCDNVSFIQAISLSLCL